MSGLSSKAAGYKAKCFQGLVEGLVWGLSQLWYFWHTQGWDSSLMVSSVPSSLGALCQDRVPLLAPRKGDWDKVGRVCDWLVSLTLAMNVAPLAPFHGHFNPKPPNRTAWRPRRVYMGGLSQARL